MSGIKIEDLAVQTKEAETAMGLSLHTVWNYYITALLNNMINTERFKVSDNDTIKKLYGLK